MRRVIEPIQVFIVALWLYTLLAAPGCAHQFQDAPTPARNWHIYNGADLAENHGFFTNWMPKEASQMIQIDSSDRTYAAPGASDIRVDVKFAPPMWCGVAIASSPNYWGENPQGSAFNLKGATKLVFRARGERGGEEINAKVAIAGDKPYGDSAAQPAETDWIDLTTEWRVYELAVDKWLNDPNVPLGSVQAASITGAYTPPVSDRNAYKGSTTIAAHGVINGDYLASYGAGLNPDAINRVELDGSDNAEATWAADATGLGVHRPPLTGMLPLSDLQAGITISLTGRSVTFDKVTNVALGAGLVVDAQYLVGAGPNDLIPFHISSLRLGRGLGNTVTGPLDSEWSDDDQIQYQINAPSGTWSSPYTELNVPSYTPDAPSFISVTSSGQTQLQLSGGFVVTDQSGGPLTSYEVQLQAYGTFSDTLLYDSIIAGPSEPSDVWNGLALPYALTIYLLHDGSGNIVAQSGATEPAPASVYQEFFQSIYSSLEHDSDQTVIH